MNPPPSIYRRPYLPIFCPKHTRYSISGLFWSPSPVICHTELISLFHPKYESLLFTRHRPHASHNVFFISPLSCFFVCVSSRQDIPIILPNSPNVYVRSFQLSSDQSASLVVFRFQYLSTPETYPLSSQALSPASICMCSSVHSSQFGSPLASSLSIFLTGTDLCALFS